MTQAAQPWVFLGASGRVGRLVAAHWREQPQLRLTLTYQTRDPDGAGLIWSPLDGAKPLVDHARRVGTPAGLMVFLGATPGQAADLSLNEALAIACMDAAAQVGIPRVLLASSSAVYGAGHGQALREIDSLLPVNDYGRAKVAMESACSPFRARGLEVCCLRIGNVAGADALLKHMGSPDPRSIEQFADGLGPERSYLGPGTLADILTTLALHPNALPPCLNIATPAPVRMADLARAAGMDWHYTPATSPAHLQSITIDCAVLQALHAFEPDDSHPQTIVAQLSDLA